MLRNAQMYESIDKFLNDCYDRREMPEEYEGNSKFLLLDNTLNKGD